MATTKGMPALTRSSAKLLLVLPCAALAESQLLMMAALTPLLTKTSAIFLPGLESFLVLSGFLVGLQKLRTALVMQRHISIHSPKPRGLQSLLTLHHWCPGWKFPHACRNSLAGSAPVSGHIRDGPQKLSKLAAEVS